jgi:hypothetical protein
MYLIILINLRTCLKKEDLFVFKSSNCDLVYNSSRIRKS